MQANVEVYIEELVLHGFATADRYRIGEAVERELTGLFAERGLPASLYRRFDAEWLDAGSFQVAAGARAEATGTGIAQAVYEGFQQ